MYKKMDLAGNECLAGLEIESQAECELAVKSISESTGIAKSTNSWQGSAGHVPPKCSISMVNGEYYRHWNTGMGNNVGAYFKICKEP